MARTALGRDFFEHPDEALDWTRLGSDYGGWCILPEHLSGDSVVYSFGVGEDVSFDMALIDRFGLVVHAFDPTPKSLDWVERQRLPPSFVMHSYGLADFDGDVSFNPPEDPDHVSHTLLDRRSTHGRAIEVPVKRLETILGELGHDHLDLLKMDIEGAEYGVIDDLARGTVRPTQLLLELHHRFEGVGVAKSKAAIGTIRGMGYRLFAVSETGEEYSFVCG